MELRRPILSLLLLLASALVTAACASSSDAQLTDAVASTVVVQEDSSTTGDDEPVALALQESDLGEDEIASVDEVEASSGGAPAEMPPAAETEAVLNEFTACLTEQGFIMPPQVGLPYVISRVGTLPSGGTRTEVLAHLFDQDAADPTFEPALIRCEPILETLPTVAGFLPTR